MVQEFRRIMLDESELVSAFESYRRIMPSFLPKGKIVRCTPLGEGSEIETVTVTLETIVQDKAQRSDHMLKSDDIAKPLIRYCIENNIMLPREGKKTVSIVGGFVSLCLSLDLNMDASENVAPMRTGHIPVSAPAVTIESTPIQAISPGDIVKGSLLGKIKVK